MAMLVSLYETIGARLQRWWRDGGDAGHCASCDKPIAAPMTECLDCLGDRHW